MYLQHETDLENNSEAFSEMNAILKLYEIESNLIQKKTGQILAIRSLSISFMVGVSTVLGFIGNSREAFTALLLLSVIFVPFYLLEAVYDSYLIPIHNREILLKNEIARILSGGNLSSAVVKAYYTDITEVFDLSKHSALMYALSRRIRVVYYVGITLVYLVIILVLNNIV